MLPDVGASITGVIAAQTCENAFFVILPVVDFAVAVGVFFDSQELATQVVAGGFHAVVFDVQEFFTGQGAAVVVIDGFDFAVEIGVEFFADDIAEVVVEPADVDVAVGVGVDFDFAQKAFGNGGVVRVGSFLKVFDDVGLVVAVGVEFVHDQAFVVDAGTEV